MNTAPLTALCDATIFTGEAMVEAHALLVRDGKILDIVGNRKIPAEAHKTSYADHILAPGFIDVQVNGGSNLLFNNTPTAETCLAIARAHRAYGTTRLLPTFITDTPEASVKAVAAMRTARKTEPTILGIHLEGPHLGAAPGVHDTNFIRAMTAGDLGLYRREDGETILVTVAPENIAPDQIRQLTQRGIIVSLGHTKALPDQIKDALAAGATGFTHLYNGMGGKDPNIPGPISAALNDSSSWCSLIADGHHVPADLIRLALQRKPRGKVFLVSDAMPPAATKTPEPYKLYGHTIRVENGRCVTADGKLAGSSITLLDAVRHCVNIVGVGIEEALRMVSSYPAAFLGLDNKLGKLLPGYEADIVALSPELSLEACLAAGKAAALS